MNKALLAIVGCAIAVTACSSGSSDQTGDDTKEGTQQQTPEVASAPPAHFDGVYRSADEHATYSVLEFVDGSHYRGWRVGGGTCLNLPEGAEFPPDCAEEGTYTVTGEKLSLVDTRTGHTTSFTYNVLSLDDAAQLGDSAIAPRDLVGAPSQVTNGSNTLLAPGQVQLLEDGGNGQPQNMQHSRIPGIVCRAACWGVAAAGTAAVAAVCTIGTVFTVGGVAIPCTVAVIAAAGGLGAGASICSDALCPQ